MEVSTKDGAHVGSKPGTTKDVELNNVATLTTCRRRRNRKWLRGFGCSYLSASSIGSKLRSAVSLGSLNQDLMGIALSGGEGTKHTHTHKQVCQIQSLEEAMDG